MKPKNSDNVFEELVKWDVALTKSVYVCSSKESVYGYLKPYLKVLEISCHGLVWLPACIALLFLCSSDTSIQFGLNLLLALILDIILVGVMKAIFRRSRPAVNNMDMFATVSVDLYSFPSGHSSRAIMLALIFIRKVSLLFVFNIIILSWALIVCFSRILLGRHHIGDVICGMTLGFVEYITFTWFWLTPESSRLLLNFIFSFNPSDNDLDL
ncbi:PPAPDC2 (predicted) [Pycnogonum litorale]